MIIDKIPYGGGYTQPLLRQTVPVAGEEYSEAWNTRRREGKRVMKLSDVPRNPILTLFGGLLPCLLFEAEELL